MSIQKLGVVMFLMSLAAACSSSKVEESSPTDSAETPVMEEAQTDAVPPPAPEEEAQMAAVTEGPALVPEAPEPELAVETSPPPAEAVAQETYIAEPVVEEPVAEPVAVAAVEEPVSPLAESGLTDGVSYTVAGGDTLMKISFETYGDLYRWREILENNRAQIQDPNNLTAGIVLQLSPRGMSQVVQSGEKYRIRTGDTLGTVSKNLYGTKAQWKTLWEKNRQLIKDPNKIYAGFYLYYDPIEQPLNRLTEQPAAAEGAPREPAAAN